jgi:hypothetical protein
MRLPYHLAETLIICTHFSPRSRLYGEVMIDVANRLTTSFTLVVTYSLQQNLLLQAVLMALQANFSFWQS